jgi:hypothetical protein
MTLLAPFLAEETGPDRRVAGRIQRTEVVEEREKAGHLRRLKLGARDPFFLEDVLHSGGVIPHDTGDLEERAVQDPPPQIGPRGSPYSVNGVAADTPLPGEEAAPFERIAREQDGKALVAREGRIDVECLLDDTKKNQPENENPPTYGQRFGHSFLLQTG